MLAARDEKHAFHAETGACRLSLSVCEHYLYGELFKLCTVNVGAYCCGCTYQDGVTLSHVHVEVCIWSSRCCSLEQERPFHIQCRILSWQLCSYQAFIKRQHNILR